MPFVIAIGVRFSLSHAPYNVPEVVNPDDPNQRTATFGRRKTIDALERLSWVVVAQSNEFFPFAVRQVNWR
jgi:hypothetical protein